jgi:hypothetical protein
MKIINLSINEINQIIIFLIIIFVTIAILMICDFNLSRKKIKSIHINRF